MNLCVCDCVCMCVVCMYYNQDLRKLSALKLQIESKAARVKRCEARAHLAQEELVKMRKTPGMCDWVGAWVGGLLGGCVVEAQIKRGM